MARVSKRELNHQTAAVLASVVKGEPLTITERGVDRWRIEAVEGEPDVFERLVAQGRITLSQDDPTAWEPQHDDARTPADVDALLEEVRGER
jgi:antitoxin (DNA-binding transcriptional repressor) of toxin-antitoxin stability system